MPRARPAVAVYAILTCRMSTAYFLSSRWIRILTYTNAGYIWVRLEIRRMNGAVDRAFTVA